MFGASRKLLLTFALVDIPAYKHHHHRSFYRLNSLVVLVPYIRRHKTNDNTLEA